MAELIQKQDTLNEGRVKLNAAITDAEQAKITADGADTKATQALANSENTQTQLDTIVINGDSSVEAAQARVDEKGVGHTTLKDRIDDGFTKVTSQLNDTRELKGWELGSLGRKPQALLSFVTDDGRIEDYTIAAPIFNDEGVPFCLSVPTNEINTNGKMTLEQLKELESQGHEIMSHSHDHTNLTTMTLAQAEQQLKDSKQWLLDNGFKGNNFTFPNGGYNHALQTIAKKYFRSSRLIDRGHNLFPIESQGLQSYWISTRQNSQDEYGNTINTFEYYKAAIDDAVANKTYLIISFHSLDIFVTGNYQQLMKDVVAYAKTKIPIVTVDEALDRIGNIVDVGIYSRLNNYDNYYVVGCNGVVETSEVMLNEDDFNPSTPPKEFPRGVSVVRTTSDSEGIAHAPNGKNGTLVTYKPTGGNVSPGYTQQEYLLFQRNVTYKRIALSQDTWSDWFEDGTVMLDNSSIAITTPITNFNLGITYTVFTSASSQIDQVPEKKPGTLVSYIVNPNGGYGYSFQEYHLSDGSRIYKRRGAEGGEWGSWKSLSVLTLADDNSFTFSHVFDDFPVGVTYTDITGNHPDVTSAPEGSRGTLITHKITESTRAGYSFQEYRIPNSGKVYQRFPLSNTSWSVWHRVGSVG